MPNVMAALSNIGGALCSTPQILADAPAGVPCSNAARTRNPLTLAGVPQTTGLISAASGHLEKILLLLLLLFFITPKQAAHRYNEHRQLKYKTIYYNLKIYHKHQSEVKKTGQTQ